MMFILTSLSAFADINTFDSSAIQPRFTHIVSLDNYFVISGEGRADIEVSIDTADADSVRLEIVLQQYLNGHWIDIKTWSSTETGNYSTLVELYYVYRGYQYRSIGIGYVYINGDMVEQSSCISDVVEY